MVLSLKHNIYKYSHFSIYFNIDIRYGDCGKNNEVFIGFKTYAY